ncbi:MAG: hypothetical protein WBV94_21110 [Blastocatellia bacterium]
MAKFNASGLRVSTLNNRVLSSVACCIFTFAFCLLSARSAQAQVVDQILTLVNEDILARSDLLWSLALDPKAPSPAGAISSDILRQKLDVMIDQRLIAQEARRVPGVQITPEDISKKRTQLISQFKSEAEFRQRVEAVGLTPQRIDDLVRQMLYIERFIDFRFRSFVFVTEQEIKNYYDERLAPEIRKQGQVPPTLDQTIDGKTVRDRISEIMKQEKINQEIDAWLNATRQRADIVHLSEP